MPGIAPPITVAKGRIVLEYNRKKLYFSQGGDLGVTAGDSIVYAIPDTGKRAKLPAEETWDSMEIMRPYDKDSDDLFAWCQITAPSDRYISAAQETPNLRLQVLSGARITAFKRTGLDQEADDLARLTITLEFDRAVPT